MMENDLISRSALKKDLLDRSFYPVIVKNALENAPAVDAIPIEKLGKIGKLFLPYKGCPRGPVGRMGDGHLEEEALFWGTIEDVDGGRWVPVVEDVLHELIEKAKAARDAQPVVRCKDCEFFEIDEGDFLGLCKCGSLATNYGGQIYPEEDFFCAYGERKTGG